MQADRRNAAAAWRTENMTVEYEDLGRMSYGESLRYQQHLFGERLRLHGSPAAEECCGRILTVEHPPVYTLGKSADEGNLLVSEEYLRSTGAELWYTDRGGDITFHGDGQTVCYPIIDLSMAGIGLRRYIELLEECVINIVGRSGIAAERLAGATGVWICDRDAGHRAQNWRKICAIGVRASRFVTMHGFALNVSTDLHRFTMINPCGITDKGVTSMERELGRRVDAARVRGELVAELCRLLGAKAVPCRQGVEQWRKAEAAAADCGNRL